MLAQVAEAIPDQLWEQPGTIIVVIIVLLAAFSMFGWLMKQNADERKANSEFITGLIVSSLESQRDLSAVMNRQAQAMSEQGEAMHRLVESIRANEALAAERFKRHEAESRQWNQKLLDTVSAMGRVPLERKP